MITLFEEINQVSHLAYHVVPEKNSVMKYGLMSPYDLYVNDRESFRNRTFKIYEERAKEYLKKDKVTDEDILKFLDNSPDRKPCSSRCIFFSFLPVKKIPFYTLTGSEYSIPLETIKKYSLDNPILFLGQKLTQVSWNDFIKNFDLYCVESLKGAFKNPKSKYKYKYILHFAVACKRIPFKELQKVKNI